MPFPHYIFLTWHSQEDPAGWGGDHPRHCQMAQTILLLQPSSAFNLSIQSLVFPRPPDTEKGQDQTS